MLRTLTRLALPIGLVVSLWPPLTAQTSRNATNSRVVAIIRLQPHVSAEVASLSAFENTPGAASRFDRDRRRSLADARLMSRIEAASRADRQRVEDTVRWQGGRVIYSLRAINAVVAEVAPEDLAALRAQEGVASVDIDEPRQAHIEVAAQSLLVPTFWDAGYHGGAVDVAVIDTGLYSGHGAFSSRASSVVESVFHQSAQYMSNYWDSPTDPDDYNGHGTYVSGVIFSQGDGSNPGRKGLAYGIDRLFNIKAGYLTYPSGGSSLLSDLMAGVDWALLNGDPPEVFNYSYGARVSTDDDLYTQFWDGVVDTYGKVATISAGNSGPNTVGSPGMAYNILSVANVNNMGTATRSDDVISASSSGGPTPGGRKKPDLAAPGTSLWMPSYLGPALWSKASGTSFSAPAVAGVAALLIDAGVADPRALKAILINSADFAGTSGAAWDPRFGWGYVNADRAFNERAQVTLVGVAGSGTGSTRFFERESAAATKATAVWNRHVTYQTGGLPSASALHNIDLRLYSRQTGDLRATSASTVDNVEQVVDSNIEGAVMVLNAPTAFTGAAEVVAVAHSGGFVARDGPAVAVSLSQTGSVAPASTFVLTGTVTNSGDMRGHGFNVTLQLPSGFSLVTGSLTQSVGSLDALAQSAVSWTVRAPATALTAGAFHAEATASAYGFSWQASTQSTVTTEAGCGYSTTPALVSMSAAGASTTIAVAAPDGCAWTATSAAPWLTVTPASGSGNGSVVVTAPANSGVGRTTTLTIAGTSIPAVQSGAVTKSYYLAEGSTRSIFTLDVAIANPHDVATDVRVTFLRPAASPILQLHHLAAKSRTTLRVDDIAGLTSTDVSTVVESLAGLPLAVERTMSWDGSSYGGHGGTAVEAPSTTWYFAEGYQGFFDTYLLLANPGDSDASATVTYLREGEEPVVRAYSIDAMSRTTVFAGLDTELVDRSFSMVVSSDVPIIAERAMYWSRPGVFWAGGHESAGVTAPALSWFLAEGATGPYFDEFILVGNPNEEAVTLSIRYLLTDGTTVDQALEVPARSRATIDVEAVDLRLANAAVSATVTASQPVVVERAMYWPGQPSEWQEAHNAFGLTETGTSWVLAEGRVGTSAGYETYILLANPSQLDASVRVTFLREQGTALQRTLTVPAESRKNIIVVSDAAVTDAPGLSNERFGAIVEVLNGVGIAVERAMYWNSAGVAWAAGTNAVATRIQ